MNYDLAVEFRTAGFVLKKQNFGEADRILKVFSKDFGLISVLAKGVKKTKSRKGGSLEIFGETNFRLHRKSGELFLLTDASPISAFESIDLSVLRAAFAASELILNLAPPEKELPRIYKIFQDFIAILPKSEKVQILKITFFAKVLAIFGFFAIEENREIREKKFFKFLLQNDFEKILKLETDSKLFVSTEKYLIELFENSAERNSRVNLATQNWDKIES
jgi:hypothetical protein